MTEGLAGLIRIASASALMLALTPDPAAAEPVSIKSPDDKVICFFEKANRPGYVYCDWTRFDDVAAKVGVRGRAKVVRAGGTILPDGVPVLGYGKTKRVGALRCTSRRAGMTCWSARSSHGFRVGRGLRPKLF